jgi:hypothetical protein
LTTRKSGVESFTNARTDTPTGKEVNKLFTLFYLALHIVFGASVWDGIAGEDPHQCGCPI